MSFPRYPKYKDSGVEWLGEVPEHWQVWKLAHAFELIGSGTTPKSDNREYYECGNIAWVNTGDLNDGELEDCEKRITDLAIAHHSSLKTYPAGSLLIAMYGATIGKLAMLRFPATVNQACCVFAGKSAIVSKFMFYWFLGLRQQIISLATGGGQPNVSQDILRTLRVACPSATEQTRIAEFLDQETAKIDALVAEQERLMALLKEKRQAVISHAVTKGLNPQAALKPSGIEWLGDVPAHWTVIKLGMISTFKGGAGFPDDYQGQTENEIPFFKVGDIVNSDGFGVMRQANHTISRETAKELRAFIFPPATIVFAKVGAALLLKRFRTLGQPSCIDNNMMGMTAGENANADFLLYCLPLLDFALIVNPGAVPSINEGQISSQRVALPPVGEQKEITAYLDIEIAKFDTLTAEAQRAIDLLQERRTALISAAVTGQIDVRNT